MNKTRAAFFAGLLGRVGLRGAPRPRAEIELTPRAAAYLAFVAVAAMAAAVPVLLTLPSRLDEWGKFALLAAAAAIAQLHVVRTPRNQSYHTTIVFLLAAVMLLPPAFLPLVAVVQHVPDWLKERYYWPVSVFNVLNYTLAMLAAAGLARLVGEGAARGPGMGWEAAGIAAAFVLVALNHLLLAPMIAFTTGLSFRESGLFSAESIGTDLVLALLGLPLALSWQFYPWLTPTAVAPLFLLHRSLSVPVLQQQAQIDPKTELFNARQFDVALERELVHARRFGRPLAVILADLDLLRDINNAYGHLAGDAVLRRVADVFRSVLRSYDIPARFGGEEFAVILPETEPGAALAIAERIRHDLAESALQLDDCPDEIRVTISMGVASCPEDATNATELIHQADMAVYRAKLEGRNRVVAAGDELRKRTFASRFGRSQSEGTTQVSWPALTG